MEHSLHRIKIETILPILTEYFLFLLSSDQRQKRSLTQDVIPFLNNIKNQYTNHLSFEIEAHSIDIVPQIREHCDSDIIYLLYKTLEITHHKILFNLCLIHTTV